MRITTSDQLELYRAEGRHFTLNRQGQLETQSSFMHLLGRIRDAFRSLTSSGRASIAARQAALQAAMDDVVLRDTLINAARTTLPRPSTERGSAGNVSLQSSSGASAGEFMAVMTEVHDMAEAQIARLFPHLDEEARNLCALSVSERMRSFLCDADMSGGISRDVLREIVSDVVRDVARQDAATSSGVGASGREEGMDAQIRTMAEAQLSVKFPQKSGAERKELLLYVCEQMRAFLPGMREDIERDPSLLKQSVTGFVNGLSGSEKPSIPPEQTHRSASLHRVRDLTAQDIRPDTIIRQGQNTCFMLSVLNSMMISEQGRRILAGALGSDGRMTVGGQAFRSPDETNGSFSPLEHSLGAAYKVYGAEVDPHWSEGSLGDALVVAQMFGMKIQSQDRVGDWSPEIIRSFLDAGQMVILYSGVHYTAVVGVDGDRLIVRNSLDMGTEEYVDVSTIGDSRLQVFAYPDE